MINKNISGLVGNTPLVKLNSLTKDIQAEVYVKLENKNPGSSVKDRLALALINDGEEKGFIKSDTVIIEPTSGNTGIGLAMICAERGYRLILTMPESMSIERRKLLKAYGAELVLSPADKGMKGAISIAEELSEKNKKSYMPGQFTNIANVEMHRKTTACEIWKDTNGEIDVFVAGVGTGGTFTGVSSRIKELNPKLISVAVEPEKSAVLSGKNPGSHKIQGIGAGFIPPILNTSLIDEIICINEENAINTAKQLAKKEGILCGVSSGANVWSAIQIASRKENKGKKIVTVIADTGERYLSTELFK